VLLEKSLIFLNHFCLKVNFLILISVIIIDQVTKYLAFLLSLPIKKNFGIAFGFFPNSLISGSIFSLLFIGIITLIFIYSIYLSKVKKDLFLTKLSLLLIISGGISNTFDKYYFGYVRDFINIKIIPFFNFADLAISIGLIIYGYQIIKSQN